MAPASIDRHVSERAAQVSDLVFESLARRRWKVAMLISAGVIIVYFGFILLVAFGKDVMGARLHPGLSLGILLGAFVILATWSLTWLYVLWANRHVDTVVLGLDGGGE